jgi:hypothetical protein
MNIEGGELITERVTNGVAAGAALSWAWLPSIGQMAPVASFILTVLGIVWLFVQIYYKIFRDE